MEAASIVAQSMPANVLSTPGTSSKPSAAGILTGSFSKLLSSLSGNPKTQAKNDNTDTQANTDTQTAGPEDQAKKGTDVMALLLSLLQVLPASSQDSSNTQPAADSKTSNGRDPTAAVSNLSSVIGQVTDSLQTSGNAGQSEAGFLSALAGLSGDLQGGQGASGSTGSTAKDATTDQLNTALNSLSNNTDAPTAQILAAVKSALSQGYPSTSDATGSDGKATDPAIAGTLPNAPDQTTGASGSQTAGGNQSTGPGFNLQGFGNPAVAVSASDSSMPAKSSGNQSASLGSDPQGFSNPVVAVSALDSSSASAKPSGNQSASLGSDPKTPGNSVAATGAPDSSTPVMTDTDQPTVPGQSKQASVISGSKETQVKDASLVKPAGSPSTQQLQTSLPQSPAGSEETNGLLGQPSQQQNNLSSATGPGQVSNPGSQTLGTGVINQIVDSAHLLVNNSNNASMSIQLKPEFLGDLKLVVQVEHGIVNANFITQNPTTASLIAARLPELRQALNDQGISWHNLNVSSGGSQGNYQGASSQSQQQNMGQAQAPYDYGYTDNADSDVQLATPAIYQWGSAGTFNYVV